MNIIVDDSSEIQLLKTEKYISVTNGTLYLIKIKKGKDQFGFSLDEEKYIEFLTKLIHLRFNNSEEF